MIEFIPYVTILIMNIFIIMKITKSRRFRKKFQRAQNAYEDQEGFNSVKGTTVNPQKRPAGLILTLRVIQMQVLLEFC